MSRFRYFLLFFVLMIASTYPIDGCSCTMGNIEVGVTIDVHLASSEKRGQLPTVRTIAEGLTVISADEMLPTAPPMEGPLPTDPTIYVWRIPTDCFYPDDFSHGWYSVHLRGTKEQISAVYDASRRRGRLSLIYRAGNWTQSSKTPTPQVHEPPRTNAVVTFDGKEYKLNE